MNKKVVAGLVLLVVMVLAAALRIYDLKNFPPGLSLEAAANAAWLELNARQIYALSAAIGVTTVGAIYFATRVWFGRLAGVIAALLLASSYWHVAISRSGSRAVVVPLLLALVTAAVGYVIRAKKQGQSWRALVYAFLGALVAASGLYVSMPFFESALAATGGGGLSFQGWQGEILSLLAGSSGVDFRYAVAGFPLLNPLVGILFLLGVAWSIKGTVWALANLNQGRGVILGMIYPYLLVLLAAGLAVAILSEEMSSGRRLVFLLLPIFLLAGCAGAALVRYLRLKLPAGAGGLIGVGRGLAIGLIGLGVLYDAALYFALARNEAGAYVDFRGDLVEVSEYLRMTALSSQAAAGEQAAPYLVLEEAAWPIVDVLLPGGFRAVAGGRIAGLPVVGGEIIVFAQSTIELADEFIKTHPQAELIEDRHNKFGQEIMRVYRMGGAVEGVRDEIIESHGLDA